MISSERPDLLLRNVRVVDARGVRAERADVAVVGERIAEIRTQPPPGNDRGGEIDVDLRGSVIAPGLINCHTHVCLDAGPDPKRTLEGETTVETVIRTAERLARIVAAGITTIRDLGGRDYIDLQLAALVARAELSGPRMICAGKVITISGGHGYWLGLESDGPDETRRAARTLIKQGAKTIKVMATGGVTTPGQVAGAPQLTIDEIAAVVDVAHKAGLTVAAHAESAVGARNAVVGGVDSIEHGHGIDAEAIELMIERGVALVPTIQSDVNILEYGVEAGIPKFVVEKTRGIYPGLVDGLQAAIRAGVRIAAGNDGGSPVVDPWDLVGELELYVRHGMSPTQALEAATSNAASLLGLQDMGLVEEGFLADLQVLAHDPTVDVANLRDPLVVIASGQPVGGRDRLTALAVQ